MSTDELLTFDHVDIRFPIELNKQGSCSLNLTNKTDNYVAFKAQTTKPKMYCVKPSVGVVLPRSSCEVLVVMQALKEAPADRQCKDKLLFQCKVVEPGTMDKEVTSEMFSKEAGHRVEETIFKIIYVAPPQPQSPVQEGLEDGSSPSASVSDKGNASEVFVGPSVGIVDLIRMSDELLIIDPVDVQFPIELNKKVSCSLNLTNKTENYVAFKAKTTNAKKYYVRPNVGVVLPRSSCEVLVIMQALKEAPADMQCRDKLLFQCKVVEPETTAKDVTSEMFSKEAGHPAEETRLKVMYVTPPQPPSPVQEGTEEGSSPRASVSDNGNASEAFVDMLRSLLVPLFSNAASSTDDHGITLPQYQVFINFRGDELRNSFVGFLVKAMRLEKINVFTDEVELRGTNLNYLFRRIEESRVAVAIFSERYTESCWCLDELVKMKEQMEQGKLVVVPVFYRLNATACKRFMGAFGDNLRNLEWEYRSEPERIQKWKEALSSVFSNIGLTSDIRSNESKFVDSIVEEVKKVLIKIGTEEREL
ncbi:vesicle-associated protein 1-4 [Arabidopsis thaliana]|uniref:Vesicle-associated protein 1-4 n=5 Tax=Arabidopsis thaliana TaxID=3702 RepID=F4I820_ARATH|nr:vesicle-associated protein 1-4 [Arabidopsis thaliana]NP_001319192.1 vesicle-associated protein 1-4 [Arabidopsis thaliana]AEE32643.1 vesicle-associated protein 1-4 [Arabidopsis thaliana]ANM58850.1 vesicle-associated protein 1-4 [Arabidopsis thaliana]|eukprot:NP_001077695.4 vesicle-associated protein 1-4 [Arabidopsis thaliana]